MTGTGLGETIGYLLSLLLVVQLLVLMTRAAQWAGWRRTAGGLAGIVPEDISGQGLKPPKTMVKQVDELEALGFRALGVTRTTLGDGSEAVVWSYAGDEPGIHAEIAQTGAVSAVLFITTWGGKAAVETGSPTWYRIEEPGYFTQPGGRSLEQAYQLHQEKVAEFTGSFGSPFVVQDIPSFIDYAAAYNDNFSKKRSDAIKPLVVGRMLSGLYSVLVIGLGVLANVVLKPQASLLLIVVALGMLPAMLADIGLMVWSRVKKVAAR